MDSNSEQIKEEMRKGEMIMLYGLEYGVYVWFTDLTNYIYI